MNYLNKSLVAAGARVGAGTKAIAESRTGAGAGVETGVEA